METKEISSLRPRGAASPIEVRVIRRWNPPFRDNQTCFLLVDKHGDGIQANAKGHDQEYTEANLLTDSCYIIEGYACVEPEPYVNTLSHPANLRIGTASTFKKISETDQLPHQYFEFASRRKINRLCENKTEVIDFIGLLLKIGDEITQTGRPYIKLILKDISNENIEVALWEEISTTPSRFDREAVTNTTHPAVIAVTAMKVKQFYNKQQLWSTRATYVYLNPSCADTEILISNFNKQETEQKHSGAEQSIRNRAITIVAENRTTIASLTKKQTPELKGQAFIFNGAVTKITTNEWCQTSCLKCGKPIYPSENQWFCTTDGLQTNTKYMYRVSAIISDDTDNINATLFDEAVKGLVGLECEDMVIKEGYNDMTTIPTPVVAIKGKNMTFHAHAQKEDRSGKVRCTVNKVSDAHIDTETDRLIVSTTPAPQTPQPPASTTKNQPSSSIKRSQLFPEGGNAGASKKTK